MESADGGARIHVVVSKIAFALSFIYFDNSNSIYLFSEIFIMVE